MRDSMIFYRSFFEAIKELPTENKIEVYDTIFSYSLDFSEPNLSGISKTIFTLIKPQLDANIKRFENGKKPKNIQKGSEKEANEKQNTSENETNKNNNVNSNVNENNILLEKESKNVVQKKEKFVAPTLQEVRAYCDQRNNRISAETFVDFYQSKDWMIGKNKMKDWQAAIRTWETNKISNQKSSQSNINGKVLGTKEIISGARYIEFT